MATMHSHHSQQPHGATMARHAGLEALGDTTDWVIATLREWRRRVHDRRQLARLGDSTLADIGLTRADAEFLSNKPFWRQ